MTDTQVYEIKKMIVITSQYYGRPINDDVVKMYLDDLHNMDFNDVVVAMKRYRMDPRNKSMFLPAHIRELIAPSVKPIDLARDTALRIKNAITKFGSWNQREARAFVGDAAWRVVERFGGWQYLCENLGTNALRGDTFMAQCRDAVESDLNLGIAGVDTSRPVLEQIDRSGSVAGLLKSLGNKLSITSKGE